MKSILFFFVDGVGLGPKQPSNPFSELARSTLYRLSGNRPLCTPFPPMHMTEHVVRPLDATLGVDGLPQSGTGQATLFTGKNCAKAVGRHFGPFPHSATHPILDRYNLLGQVRSLSDSPLPVAFANAFPPPFFNADRHRATVTTHCCKAAGIELRDHTALRNERALPADLTGQYWRDQLDLEVPVRSLSDAGRILAQTAQTHALTLFEYFLTDKVGHDRIDIPAATLLTDLDRFLTALLDHLDPAQHTLLLTSDHGNLEDTSHTQHTRNPVPLIAYGWAAPFFTETTTLMDVTPALLDALRSARL